LIENEQTQILKKQTNSQSSCLSQSWMVLIVAAAIAFVLVACGATTYMWWLFIRTGNFNASVRSAGTLIASERKPASPSAAAKPMVPMIFTTAPRPSSSPTATLSSTPTQAVRVVISSVLQKPITATEEIGALSSISMSGPTPSGTIASTLILSLPPTPVVITPTSQSTATLLVANSPTPSSTSGLRLSTVITATRRNVVRETPEPRPTNTPASIPVARPQGHIAFPAYSPVRRNWDLYIAKTDGSGRTLLREQASLPAFSPGSSQLAFRSLHPSFLGLGLLDLGSKEFTQLTRYAEDAWPSWSRDVATLLLFSSQRQSDRRWRIYGAMADGKTEWEMAVDNKPIYGQFPAWLPGSRLIYSGCVKGQCGLILADGDGSNPRAITTNPNDAAPAVSPDGQWVAFISLTGKQWDLYVINVTTGATVPLVQSEANEGVPVWSPDGNHIAFVSNRDGTLAIWAVPFQANQGHAAVPTKLFDLTDLPPEGWPWLSQGIAWGP